MTECKKAVANRWLLAPNLSRTLWPKWCHGKKATFHLFSPGLGKRRADTWRWKFAACFFLHHVSMKWNVPQHSQGFAKPFWCGQRLPWVGWKVGRQWKMREFSGADFLWYHQAGFAVISRNPYYPEAKRRRLPRNDSASMATWLGPPHAAMGSLPLQLSWFRFGSRVLSVGIPFPFHDWLKGPLKYFWGLKKYTV